VALGLQALRSHSRACYGNDEWNECVFGPDDFIGGSIKHWAPFFQRGSLSRELCHAVPFCVKPEVLALSALASFFVLGLRDHAHR
jgi:hypothetical protein